MARVQAGASPTEAATPESIARGKALYETHCLPCHGAEGHGDGPLDRSTAAHESHADYVQQQPDGQLYTITGQRRDALLHAIVSAGSLHVVNYVKHALVP
jgi:mono/diheme cytochrome c family protein